MPSIDWHNVADEVIDICGVLIVFSWLVSMGCFYLRHTREADAPSDLSFEKIGFQSSMDKLDRRLEILEFRFGKELK